MPHERPSSVTAIGGELNSTTRVNVPMASELSQVATQGHMMNSLQTVTLISIGQLCDDDCVAIFSKYNCKIVKMARSSLKSQALPIIDYGQFP